MALDDTFNITRPGQIGATGDLDATHIEEYTGVVESTIERRSVMAPRVPVRTVRGTSTFTNFAVGESTLQKLTPGASPDGTVNKFGKISLQVEVVVIARSVFPLLETFQTSYDSRAEVGREHGKKIAKFYDQSFLIQGIKTASLSNTAYSGVSGAGHNGGSQIQLATAGDESDPAKVYDAIIQLCVEMEEKDVDPQGDDLMLVVKPSTFGVLMQNEWLINSQYVTAMGTSVDGQVLRTNGLPVVKTNNLPAGEVISSHLLSTTANSNAFDGDFSDVVALILAPQAIMAGATIPLTTGVFWDDRYKHWYVDAWLSYTVGPNRAEYAGVILKA